MQVITFDVEHGSNHLIRTPNDQIVMIDAGNTETFSPARYISDTWQITDIRWFALTHHDTDHLADIENVTCYLDVKTLQTPSLSVEQLRVLYNNEFSAPLQKFLEFRQRFSVTAPPIHDPSYDWGGVRFASFDNDYSDFENLKSNNLSIVTFALYMGWTFLFPGDLEESGWLMLLQKPEFREWLRRVDIFIASHHGRESGYCEEVFEYCTPKLVLISDKSHTEPTYPDLYRAHARGLFVRNAADVRSTRYVLTTRKDGAIKVYIDPEGRYRITTSA